LTSIVNITNKKKVDKYRYNGTVNINIDFRLVDRSAGGSFAFKHNKFGMSALGGAGIYNAPKVGDVTNRTKGIKRNKP